ncbi:hypothetical protein [Streptomyces chryseus]|uniref:hypothetical protein n=1 Tax=Streptomyces chryseus TaxID=68186 RepID=UPI0027E3DAC8|nr:hypothetical protein [Streptomyces chryseus]
MNRPRVWKTSQSSGKVLRSAQCTRAAMRLCPSSGGGTKVISPSSISARHPSGTSNSCHVSSR